MKNFLLLYIILCIVSSNINAQNTAPFNYLTYVDYDYSFDATGSHSAVDHGYRDNQDHYIYNSKLMGFVYYNDRVTKKLKKPFVFVEGISFNKETSNAQTLSLNDYIDQPGFFLDPDNSIINYPLISGFQKNGAANPVVGYSTFNWATLVSGFDSEGYIGNDPLNIQKLPSLLNKLICAGYDIVFIDFLSGEEYIEKNGEALFNAISELKQLMANDGCTEKMAICGASMGGLVARYAMRKHELAGHTDWFSHFISFDSPQQGANINLSLQYTLKHLSSFPFLMDDAKESFAKVTCPSASQLVKYSCLSTNVQPPIVYTTPSMSLERAQLVLNPNMISWPTSCRRVSITNGSRYGYVQNGGSYTNGCQVFDGEGAIEIELYSLPNTMTTSTLITNVHVLNNCPFLSGSLWAGLSKQVYVSNCLPLDNLAGSYRNDLKDLEESMPQWMNATGLFPMPVCNLLDADDYFQNFANPSNTCFIPLLSSAGIIDFDNSVSNSQAITQALFQGKEKFEDPQHTVSHFDVVYAPIDNQTHVEITDENIEWVMTELVANQHIVFQNETIPNGTYLARESIKAGWDVDKYGDQCAQIFQPAMHPQYTYSPNYIQTCGPVVTQTGTVVVLHAGSRIELHPGFSSTDAFYFEASIMDGLGCGTQSGARYADEGYSSGANNTGLVAGVQPMINLEEKNMQADTEKITFVLAPNPTRGGVVLKSNCSEAKLIEIRDVQGRLLKRTESNLQNTNLDLTDLPAGLYYVSSVGDNHRFVSKVLKE